MRIRGDEDWGVPHAGECGISVVLPPALSVVVYTSPSYPVSISPVVPPSPSPSPAAMPASRILSRAIARPPVPRVLKPVSPPLPPPQIHAMLLAADHEKNHSRWRGTLPPCTQSPSPPTPSPGRPPSQTVSVSPQRPSPERPPLPSASGSTPVPGQTLPTPAGLPTSSR